MNTFWRLSGLLLLGASVALSGCGLGDENGNTDTGSATPPPVTPLSYSGATGGATFTQNITQNTQTGAGAGSAAGGLIGNSANGGLGNIIGPISVAAGSTERASNATIVSLFASLDFSTQAQPAAVVSQPLDNAPYCPGSSTGASYYLSGKYIVVTFDNACLAVLPGSSPANEAAVNGQVVVFVSEDVNHYTFTPHNLTVTSNSTGDIFSVPAGTYMLDKTVTPAALTILVKISGLTYKVTMPTADPTAGPTYDAGTDSWDFSGATVYDPLLGSFDMKGFNLQFCSDGSGTTAGPFSSGYLVLKDTAATPNYLTVTFTGCGSAPDVIWGT